MATKQHSNNKSSALKEKISSDFKASLNKDLGKKTGYKFGRNRTEIKENFGLQGESTYGERSLSHSALESIKMPPLPT